MEIAKLADLSCVDALAAMWDYLDEELDLAIATAEGGNYCREVSLNRLVPCRSQCRATLSE